MSETTYYSALHYAKKAEKSAQEAAEKAASVNAENLVDRTSNQTIGGAKTFTGSINVTNTVADASVVMKNTNDDYTTTPTAYQSRCFRVLDKNDKILGDIRFRSETNGSRSTTILARNKINGTEVSGSIVVIVDAKGNVSTYAPTPATTENNNQIATTAFVNNKLQVVDSLPSSPTAGVFYFVKES